MTSIQFIKDIENRKEMLVSHWLKTQEGGAYWWSLKIFKKNFFNKSYREHEKANLLANQVERNLLKANDHNGEGFRMVNFIEQKWGEELTLEAITACLHPDIRCVSMLRSPVTTIEGKLKTTQLSPDLRLKKLYEICDTKRPIVTKEYNELYAILDHENPSMLSIDKYNNFWNDLDADEDFISLMKRLHERLGVTTEYKPVVMKSGEGSSRNPVYGSIIDKKGGLITELDSEEAKKKYKKEESELKAIIKNSNDKGLFKLIYGKNPSFNTMTSRDFNDMKVFLQSMEGEGLL